MKSLEQASRRGKQSPPVAALSAPSCSALDAWQKTLRDAVGAETTSLAAEDYHRMIELVVQRQANRHHLTPEALLWDWMDAQAEVKSH